LCDRLRVNSGLKAGEESQYEAEVIVLALRDRIVEIRAATLAGLIFKAKYAAEHYRSEYDPEVMASIVDDLLALDEEAANV
jgi:hypothetical protein